MENYGRMPLMVMEGISHVIVTDQVWEKDKAEVLLRNLGTSLQAEALGIMFYDRARNFLTPLVWVRDTDTMFWESSCASGSAALAMYLKGAEKGPWQLEFQEPGGTLAVEKDGSGDVTLGGPVSFSEVIIQEI